MAFPRLVHLPNRTPDPFPSERTVQWFADESSPVAPIVHTGVSWGRDPRDAARTVVTVACTCAYTVPVILPIPFGAENNEVEHPLTNRKVTVLSAILTAL